MDAIKIFNCNGVNCSKYDIFFSILIIMCLISTLQAWIIITGDVFRKIVPVIPYLCQYFESTISTCAMFSLFVFKYGSNSKQVIKFFSYIRKVDQKCINMGIFTDIQTSITFKNKLILINILLCLLVIITHTIVQILALETTALTFTLHNVLPTFLSTTEIIRYVYILHLLERRSHTINYNIKNLIKTISCPDNKFYSYSKIRSMFQVHDDIIQVIEILNATYSLILLILLFYLLTIMLFRLYNAIQIFLDFSLLNNNDRRLLLLSLVTLERQFLVQPFVMILIYFNEKLRKQVNISVTVNNLTRIIINLFLLNREK